MEFSRMLILSYNVPRSLFLFLYDEAKDEEPIDI